MILLVIGFLLFGYFRSPFFAIQVLCDIPLALVGGLVFTYFKLNNISIATLVGFIAVAGVAARNSIMLISHYLHLMQHEGESFTKKMVIRGTKERLVPVLMTALAAGIGLIPLVLAADQPGKEILHPVAVVIVGGLITSTLLGLGVTPTVFFTFGRKAAAKIHRAGIPRIPLNFRCGGASHLALRRKGNCKHKPTETNKSYENQHHRPRGTHRRTHLRHRGGENQSPQRRPHHRLRRTPRRIPVTTDKKIEIRFLDDAGKVVAPAAQVVTVTMGDRANPTKLAFTKDGDKLVSDKAIPEGKELPVVVQIKTAPDAKSVTAKFSLNLAKCPTCEHAEYACTCAHGGEEKGHEGHDHK